MSQPTEAVGEVLRDGDVCELLGISRNALRRLCRHKAFPFTHVGIKRVYLKSEVVKWIKLNQEPRASG